MKCVDPGHVYLLDSYDGGGPVQLTFMKREGDGYPFNVGHHPGTNCQEVLCALLDRVNYMQSQIPCVENHEIITLLQIALYQFELRAARRHGRVLKCGPRDFEELPTCSQCGHVECQVHGLGPS